MKKPRVVVTEPRTSRWGLLGGDVCSAAGMRSWWMSCWLWRRWHCNVVWVFGIVICYNCDTRDRSVRTSLKQSLIFSWLVVKLEAWLILCDVSLWAHLLTPYHMFGRWCQIEGANNHRFAILPQSVSFCFRQPLSLRSNPSTKRGFMLVTFKSPPPPRAQLLSLTIRVLPESQNHNYSQKVGIGVLGRKSWDLCIPYDEEQEQCFRTVGQRHAMTMSYQPFGTPTLCAMCMVANWPSRSTPFHKAVDDISITTQASLR